MFLFFVIFWAALAVVLGGAKATGSRSEPMFKSQ
jgi:hypothetical protein